jgi:hypothetical protein
MAEKGDARDEIKDEFAEKGGASVGSKDTVVDGKLDNIKGSSQRAYGGDNPVRPQLGETAKKPDR